MTVEDSLRRVRRRIIEAARRAGRDPGEITLVAVSKTVAAPVIKEALALGVKDLGENRVQELIQKQPLLPAGLNWHFIGHLQTNKVKKIIDKVSLIHSLDRWTLAEEISRAARGLSRPVQVLVQVNVAGEETKHGLDPGRTEDFVRQAAQLPGLEIRGLMTMAPWCADPEEVRPVFRKTMDLARQLKERVPGVKMDCLSMGMTGDFEVAVEEGATILRVGTAIFGGRG